MRKESAIANPSERLGAEECKDDGTGGRRAGGKDVRQGQDGGGAGGVVVGAVVVGISGRVRRADAEVVKMRGKQNHFVECSASAQDADRIPRLLARHVLELREALLDSVRQRI